jgi:hypothetical protein
MVSHPFSGKVYLINASYTIWILPSQLGTGKIDHKLMALVSKQFSGTGMDFNRRGGLSGSPLFAFRAGQAEGSSLHLGTLGHTRQ